MSSNTCAAQHSTTHTARHITGRSVLLSTVASTAVCHATAPASHLLRQWQRRVNHNEMRAKQALSSPGCAASASPGRLSVCPPAACGGVRTLPAGPAAAAGAGTPESGAQCCAGQTAKAGAWAAGQGRCEGVQCAKLQAQDASPNRAATKYTA